MGRKITLEDKKNAVKVALGGGDPEEYLRSQGIKDTRQAWYRIRTDLKIAARSTWEMLEAMKKEGRRKKEPEPEETPAPVQPQKTEEDIGLKICMLKGKKNIYRMYGDELTIMNDYGSLGEKYNLGSVEDVELFIKELKEAIKRFTA